MPFRLSAAAVSVALPFILFAVAMTAVVNRKQNEEVKETIRHATATSLRAVDERVAQVRSALDMLATSQALVSGNSDGFAERARRALRQRQDWVALRLAGRDGVAMLIPRAEGLAGPLPPFADAVFRSGTAAVSGVLTDPQRVGEPVVAISVPVSADGAVTHALTAYVRAWTFNRVLADQRPADPWVIAVLDAQRRFVARTLSANPGDRVLGGDPDASAIAGMEQSPDYFLAVTTDGDRVYAAAATSSVTGWTVMVGAPAASIETALRRTQLAVTAGGGAALVLAGAILWTLGRAFSRRERAERRVVALEAAAAAERRTAAILESTADGVIEIGRDWKIRFLNTRARAFLVPTAGPEGRPLWEVHPDGDRAEFRERYRRVMEDRAAAEFEAHVETLDRWYAVRAFPTPEGIAVYFQDSTERHRLAEELGRHEALLERVLETLPVGVVVVAADGTVLRINPAAQRIWGGWRPVGLAEYDAYHAWWADTGERLKPEDWAAARALRHGEVSLGEVLRIEGFDGSRKTVLHSALPVRDAAGTLIGALTVIEDISDRLAAERALHAAKEEAELAALSKSKFLAAASHDLRQPLQSLFLFAGALHGHALTERGQEVLDHLERGLEVMKSLLDSLLDVSRLDAGVVHPELEDFPVAALLDHIDAGYGALARGKGLDWSVGACPAVVRSDRVLLGRMLRNLIENAIRYTEHGGVEVRCETADGHLHLVVHDTGIGIAEDQIALIFDEFHQVGNPERDRSQGLGLGLAIVDRIARLLDHRVSVESRLGEGAVFRIAVPLGAAGEASSPLPTVSAAAAAAAVGERLAVLIDDDAIVLMGLQAMLEEWGYDVQAAASPAQAMDKLRARGRAPDVIIADYRLREGEVGTDAILAIRALFGVEVPGIVVTGETGPDCQRDAARHGFDLMHKPVSPRQLNTALERLLTART